MPTPGKVVHAAGVHHAQDGADELAAHGPLPGQRMHAAIGQRGRHERQIAAIHLDRTLLEVQLQRGARVVLHDVVVAQHVADGAVAVAGGVFRCEHGLVHLQVPAGIGAQGGQDALHAGLCVAAGHEGAGGDRTGVDHRVARSTGPRFQADGVEGVARGFYADGPVHPFGAAVFQRRAEHQRLGDGLDGEASPRVAHFIDVPVHGGDDDAKGLRVGFGQFRYVVRHLAGIVARKTLVQTLQKGLDR